MSIIGNGIGVPFNRGGGGGSSGIVTDGLILNLDSTDALSYPGSGTTWSDLSPEGNDFTLVNGPTFDSEKGGCIVTDGVNDYMQTIAKVTESKAPISAFAYIKCSNLISTGTGGWYYTWFFNKRPSGAANQWQIFSGVTPTDWAANGYASIVASTNFSSALVSTPLYEDEWAYIGFTSSGVIGGTKRLYKNGVEIASITETTNRILDTQYIRAGMNGWDGNFGMPGKTKNLHLYETEISADDVLQNYNAIK